MALRQIRNELLVGSHERRLENIEAIECTFRGAIRLPKSPGDWTVVRNCRAVRCNKTSLGLSGVAFEYCELDGFGKVGGLLSTFLYACVFNQVVLKGRLPAVSIKPYYLTPGTSIDLPQHAGRVGYDEGIQRLWEEAMHRFYRDVEWALDIRQARFRSFIDFLGVPGHLIVRDSARHVLVKREKLIDERWRSLPQSVSLLAIKAFFEHSPFDSFVMAAASDEKRGSHHLEEFRHLRDLGIAEPA